MQIIFPLTQFCERKCRRNGTSVYEERENVVRNAYNAPVIVIKTRKGNLHVLNKFDPVRHDKSDEIEDNNHKINKIPN